MARLRVLYHNRTRIKVIRPNLLLDTQEAARHAVEEVVEVVRLVDVATGSSRLAVRH